MSIKSLHGHSKVKEGSVDGSPKYGLGAEPWSGGQATEAEDTC